MTTACTVDAITVGGTPLAIDLDGTLLKSDLLVESALMLMKRSPWLVLMFPIWLLSGKARLKQEIAARVELNLHSMPWDGRVLALVRAAQGLRPVVLCTASDQKLAMAVAEHLGGFDRVLASDGERNLSGRQKARLLIELYGERGFDYAGNESVDLAVWSHARRAIVVNASESVERAAARHCPVESSLPDEARPLKSWPKALRLHQWLKNLLVFLPLLAAHKFTDPVALVHSALGFLAFGICASSVYLLNDLLDLESDRRHASKRSRPFAAGSLPLWQGLIASPLMTLASLLLAAWVSYSFAGVLLIYYLLTMAYSFRLKKRVMVDVVVLAGLYTLRIIGGAVLLAAAPSFWLLAFSMFLFLSLAMLKRYTELLAVLGEGRDRPSGRGYDVDDLPLVQSFGAASGYQAVLVLALYINSTASDALYRHPQVLWLLCPLLLYWISRIWMIAHRGLMRDDPVIFAATDRTSQLILLACGLVVAGAI